LIEYSNPLSENSTFEAGFSHEQNKQDIKNNADYFDTTSQSFVIDLGKTNHFLYNDAIDAFYATFEHSFGKIGFLGGLRYEYAQNKSHLITGDSTYKNNYSNIYPTCHLGYKLGENSELQLNYSKRTNRPEGEDLNPFPEYRDPLNIDAGNPKLLPEYIHSIELGWQIRKEQLSVTPSIYYRYRYNGFTSVTEPLRDSILLTTMRNLSSDQSEGVELIVNGSIGNYLDADLSANAFYNTIDASNIGFGKKKSTTSWSGTFNINYKLRPTTILQTNSYFRSTRLTPQGKYLANFVVNFGMRQDLFRDKFSLTFTISDIFNSRIQKTQTRTTWLTSDTRNGRDARIAYLGIMYHFGEANKKNAKKPLEYEQ
jgi:outer membrane receptor protein involved in Fe transport